MNAPDAPYRPVLTDAARPSTFEVEATDDVQVPVETVRRKSGRDLQT